VINSLADLGLTLFVPAPINNGHAADSPIEANEAIKHSL